MYCRLIVVSAMLLACGVGRAESAPPTPYYLALGDSLAVGVQPDAAGTLVHTHQGYVDDLYALLRLQLGLLAIRPDMIQILGDLRTAVGPSVPIVGMNYYDPFLAAWTLGPAGQVLAKDSLEITNVLNFRLGRAYSFFNVPVADVARAYRINDFTPVPVFNLPLNVLLELRWTWIGASPPVRDIHPNATGYAVIALAFLKAMGV